jgi:hypothetical protein
MTFEQFKTECESRCSTHVGYDEVGKHGWTTLDEFPERIKTGQLGPHWADAHPVPRTGRLIGKYDFVTATAVFY